jgi:hypothetical protein
VPHDGLWHVAVLLLSSDERSIEGKAPLFGVLDQLLRQGGDDVSIPHLVRKHQPLISRPNVEIRGQIAAITGRFVVHDDNARTAIDAVGKRRQYSGDEALRRDRDGLAHISKQFVRFGLTSVCHESGNLLALQQVRERGDLLHRVS